MAVWSVFLVVSLTIRDYLLYVLPVKVALGLCAPIVLPLCVGSDLGDMCSRLRKVGTWLVLVLPLVSGFRTLIFEISGFHCIGSINHQYLFSLEALCWFRNPAAQAVSTDRPK